MVEQAERLGVLLADKKGLSLWLYGMSQHCAGVGQEACPFLDKFPQR